MLENIDPHRTKPILLCLRLTVHMQNVIASCEAVVEFTQQNLYIR